MMEILYIVLRKDVEVMQISFLLWIENDVAKLISHDQPPPRRTDADGRYTCPTFRKGMIN